MSDFEKFKEELPSKEKFYSSLTDRKISDKEYEHVLNVWTKFWNGNDERLSWLVFKMWYFIISRYVWKIYYQLKITDLYNISSGNLKQLAPASFDKKSMCFIMKTYNFT